MEISQQDLAPVQKDEALQTPEAAVGAAAEATETSANATEAAKADAPDGDAPLEVENEMARAIEAAGDGCPAEPSDNEKSRPELRTKEEVIAALKELAEADAARIGRDELAFLKQRFYAIHNAEAEALRDEFVAGGGAPEDFKPALDPAEEEFKALLATVKEKKAALLAAEEAAKAENLARKQALIAELKGLSEDADNANRVFPRVKEIQAEFKEIGEVPATEATDLWKEFQGTVEQFYDQLKINKDLRDYDFRKNLELKTLLCEEAEKLDQEEDIVLAFKRLQNFHDEWRQTGPVAKEVRDEIWNRFKDASSVIRKKYQAFFEERKAREEANEKAKTEICERVEALDFDNIKSYAGWDEMTNVILQAQKEWKELGYASRKANNALFARFRAVCDRFFTLKAERYRAMKDELQANLAKKTALCEKAEALSQSTDWRKTADQLVALQKEWKTIGTVPRKHSDAVWQRFQKACDSFFENRKKNLSESRSTEEANLAEKRQVIADLKAIPADMPRNEAMPKVKELQAKWNSIGHVPFREKDKVYAEYRAVCDAFYNREGDRGDRGMSRFEDVIKEIGSDQQKLYRERERVQRACEIKRNELKTYENNLGFLSSKSKAGDSMVREMERRIQRIKDDLAATEAKIKLIDAKLKG
ncbi:MAG: DUF349 domain-containing protein [[Clostridium] fimetarium]|nr:DUF349 domain-containing protein [Alistipes timonensis]MCM1405625.1 DUF349 domain-containing protein [[Clostridium] fimetarium]